MTNKDDIQDIRDRLVRHEEETIQQGKDIVYLKTTVSSIKTDMNWLKRTIWAAAVALISVLSGILVQLVFFL
jgi:hypothetical protein